MNGVEAGAGEAVMAWKRVFTTYNEPPVVGRTEFWGFSETILANHR